MGAATAGAGIGLKVAAEMEQAKIGFTTMLGSAKQADSFIRKLADFAAKTPFDFPTLQKAASRLIAVGTEADRVIPIMTVLGDATAAMGTGAEGVDRAVMALQQMQVKGKVTGEEMLQLAEAGVPAWEALAAQLGVTTGEAQKMVTAGKVSVEDLFTAIETRQGAAFQRMNGMMDQQATTLTGIWSTAVDTVQMKLASTMQPLIPAIKNAMNAAIPVIEGFLGTVEQKFNTLVEQTPNLLSALADQDAQGVAEVLDNILGNTGKHIDTIRTAAEQFFPVWNSIKGTFQNLLDIARDLGPTLGVILGGGLRLTWEIIQLLAPALESITRFLADNEWAAWGLFGAITALTVITKAHAAAMAVQTAGGFLTWIKKVTGYTKVATAVQWAWNLAMRANPIGLVVTALAALVGGLVWAWNNSETFRSIVTGVFNAVATAGQWMWENILKPVWTALSAAWNALVTGIKWLWDTVLEPVFTIIGKVAQALAITLMVVVFGPIMLAWKALTEGIKFAWEHILKPVWDLVATVAQWLWNNILKPVFGWIGAAWTGLLTGIQWAWTNILKPVWDAVSTVCQWLWNNVLKPVFGFIGAAWNALLTGFKWAWDNILKPVWDAVSTAANWLWNTVLKPIFDAIGKAWDGLARGLAWVFDNLIRPIFDAFGRVLDTIKTAFSTAVEWIARVWDGLKNALMTPVQWVIDFVWNNGLRKLWNWINNLWDGEDLKEFKLASGGIIPPTGAGTTGGGGTTRRLATGGVMPGYTPGRDVHHFISPTGGRLALSGGEAVMRPEFTRAMGLHGVNALNAAARSGGVQGVANALAAMNGYHQAHARGGVIELPGWAKAAIAVLPGGNILSEVVDAVNSGDGWGGGLWGDALFGTVKKVGKGIWDKVKSWFDSDGGGGGGFGASRATPNGVGGLGPMAAAARAFVQATWGISNIGGYANRNIAGTGTKSDHALGKAIDIMIPNYKSAASIALGNTIANWFVANPARFGTKYVIWRDRINEGRGWSPYGHPGGGRSDTLQHRDHVHLSVFDDGGILPPGLTLANNKSRKPEGVLTHEQLRWLQAAASGGGGAAPLVGGDLVLRVDRDDDVRDQMESAMFELRRIKRGGGVR
jgi:tape measure domain-containing protein